LSLRLTPLAIVRRVLRHWDPIGVIEDANASTSDEYDSYAPGVLKLLESGAGARDLALRLAALRVGAMQLGQRQPTQHEAALGEQLATWRDSGFATELELMPQSPQQR
jgi:hypothetical protein